MVGGLLVSYRLERRLRGASSTEGGTDSGCEGSVMEPCTGVALGALRRLEGDEDLSSLVFCHGYLREGSRRCARVLGSDGGQMEGCFGLAPLWHLREVQMTGLK